MDKCVEAAESERKTSWSSDFLLSWCNLAKHAKVFLKRQSGALLKKLVLCQAKGKEAERQ